MTRRGVFFYFNLESKRSVLDLGTAGQSLPSRHIRRLAVETRHRHLSDGPGNGAFHSGSHRRLFQPPPHSHQPGRQSTQPLQAEPYDKQPIGSEYAHGHGIASAAKQKQHVGIKTSGYDLGSFISYHYVNLSFLDSFCHFSINGQTLVQF